MFSYHNLDKIIVGLSPMDGVTDISYREICKRYGGQDLTYTEFQNVHGLSLGIENLFDHFAYTDLQRPILAQIYGHEVEYFFPATIICLLLGFDGVDINMGCPAKKISDRGAGAGLIQYPQTAQEIISEAKRARKEYINFFEEKKDIDLEKLLIWLDRLDVYSGNNLSESTIESLHRYNETEISWRTLKVNWGKILKIITRKLNTWNIRQESQYFTTIQKCLKDITISVKTRIGYDTSDVENWIPNIVQMHPDFIAIHGRTLKQLYTGTADWSEIAKAISIGRDLNPDIAFIANGDIKDLDSAKKCLDITKSDGLLIGRGTYGDPSLLRNIRNMLNGEEINSKELDIAEIKEIIVAHTQLYERSHPENFFGMRKNLAWYISGIPNAVELRKKLVLTNNSEDVIEILNNI